MSDQQTTETRALIDSSDFWTKGNAYLEQTSSSDR